MSILAFDIGGTSIKYGLSDGQGGLTRLGERGTQARFGGCHVADTVLDILREFPEAEAVGIATAGAADPLDGHIVFATDNIPQYTGLPLGRMVSQACGKPVCVENDVHAAALGELAYGCGKNLHSFLFLTYGTGIGGAYVTDGRLIRGARGMAGYFGHIIIHPGGRKCTCRQRGCYEAYASASALLGAVREKTGRSITGRQLFEEPLNAGILKECLDDWLEEVVLGLATLVNAFDPEAVILGGGIMSQSLLIGEIRCRLPQYLPPISSCIPVLPSELGNTAGMLGAAYRVTQKTIRSRGG